MLLSHQGHLDIGHANLIYRLIIKREINLRIAPILIANEELVKDYCVHRLLIELVNPPLWFDRIFSTNIKRLLNNGMLFSIHIHQFHVVDSFN